MLTSIFFFGKHCPVVSFDPSRQKCIFYIRIHPETSIIHSRTWISYFPHCHENISDKRNLRKEGLSMPQNLWAESMMVEKAWWQELDCIFSQEAERQINLSLSQYENPSLRFFSLYSVWEPNSYISATHSESGSSPL